MNTATADHERATGYIPQIDGLRAVAILAVMIYHLAPALMPGGFVGVDIFFVISGYVVSASLARDAGRPSGQFFARFYARRMVRIAPPLVACLVASSIVATMFIPNAWLSNTSQWTALFAFVGLGNAAMVWLNDSYFSPRVEFNPYVHTWSLGVEEQFYLMFPVVFLAWVALRQRTGPFRRAGTWLLASILLLSLAYAWRHMSVEPDRAFYLLPGRLWELASGALVFQLQDVQARPVRSAASANALLWTGSGLVLIGCFLTRERGYPFPWALTAVAGAMLLVIGVTARAAPDSPVAHALGSRAFVQAGKLSYSLYLWHWPVYVLHRWTVGLDGPLQAASAIVLTTALATLSYRFVEKPIRGHPAVRTSPPLRVVAAGLVIIAVCVGLTIYVFALQHRISLSVTTNSDAWFPNPSGVAGDSAHARCRVESGVEQVNGLEIRTFTPAGCEPAGPHRLFVIGDSHALAYSVMLYRLSEDLGVPVRLYSNGGCSFANMHKDSDPKWMECAGYYRAAAAHINAAAEPGDVVFLAGLRLNRLGDQWGRVSDSGGATTPNSAGALRQRADALEETATLISSFGASGARVVIDAPAPIFRSPAFRCSDWFNRGNPVCAGGLTIPRAFLEAYRRAVVDSLRTLAGRFPRLVVWDPFPVLCPGTTCAATDDRGPLFFDGDHLSGAGNRIVYPSFAALLTRTWALSP